ncbi:hypothetical protein JB92DRAFT_1850134 [Gautieria morchelliformis]|nr:hypothetical protein JB92DRAFT_1850134 [Gautieria morchelliformis]
MPLNNAAASPSSGSTPSNSVQGDLGQSSGASEASPTLLTPAGTNGVPNSGALGSPNAPGGGNGSTSGSGSPGNNHASSSASHSHLSSAAIGGIVAAVVIIGGLLVFILRQRHKRRKAERQVKWINGYVTGQTADMRVTSMRSSWGTPIEHRFSDPFRWSAPHVVNTQESAYDNAESPYPHAPSHSGAPVLPMPVHSPVEDRSYSPENPFADGNASRQPIKPLSSLPLRISLLSTGSDTPDPFDDAHGHIVEDHNSESHISSATFGHGSGLNRDPTLRTQANFPMPPPTAGSSSTGFAIGSPDDLLQLPGILISFPDSPVSPTFAATGTASYPRRASVKLGFHPSQERRDEVQLQQGDQVSVVSVYEDGWAFIQNEKNNDRGLVPLNCLELDNP